MSSRPRKTDMEEMRPGVGLKRYHTLAGGVAGVAGSGRGRIGGRVEEKFILDSRWKELFQLLFP